ncbi:TetR/AcrR family transcriptional regulator [Alphaproteobacteria bacterium]|nr:TetR/AcrR family transcriptional regulator [Alphaproteobacteria bacterium]
MNNALKMFKRGRPKTLNLDELIDVAMITYWSEGPANVSINQICNKAKISKPGLYRELGGEDGLMESVLIAYKKKITIPILEMFKLDKKFDNTLNSLISFITEIDDNQKKPKGCLLEKLRQSKNKFGPKTQRQINLIRKKVLLCYKKWVEQSKIKNEFPSSISSELAANYLDTQLNNALSEIANGVDRGKVKEILTLSLSVLRKNK